MFWDRLSVEEQERYRYISQRLAKYVKASMAYPKALKDYETFLEASDEKRAEMVAKTERRINHWIQQEKNHVKITPVEYFNGLKDEVLTYEVEMKENFC